MKFRRKPGTVEVGALGTDATPQDLGAYPMLAGMSSPVRVMILTDSGKAFGISPALLESKYEPADADAEAWLMGLRERLAPRPPPGFGLPMELLRPDGGQSIAESFDMEVQTDPDMPPQKISFRRKPQKPRPRPAEPHDPPRLRPAGWPDDLPWPPGTDLPPGTDEEGK